MAQHSQPLDLGEALEQLKSTIDAVEETELIPLAECRDRVTADDMLAPVDLPPFRASSMDGYALARAPWLAHPDAPLKVIGQSLAGHPFTGDIRDGECVRVFTGAMVPASADQVVLQEEVATLAADSVQFNAHVPGEPYIRGIGNDISQGQVMLQAGTQLTSFAVGSLAAAGIASVPTKRRVRVGVFSTGDELIDPGQTLAPGQIFDSNRLSVLELLRYGPYELSDLGRLPDSAEATRSALQEMSQSLDVIITSGGVSVGDADFVTHALSELGELDFWRLNLKPGKPMAVGRLGKCVLFGLPGNPVSTIVTLLLVARPAILHLAGVRSDHGTPLRVPAQAATKLSHSPGRTEFQRGSLVNVNGVLQVSSTGDQGSNRLSSFTHADCLIEVPKESGDINPGDQVMVLLLNGLAS